MKSLSRARLFATPLTVAYQASQSMGFSRQEYQSGLPFPSPGDLSDPVIEPQSPTLQADTLLSEPPGKSGRTDAEAETQTPIYLMRRADSLEKTLMLGKIEGKKRRG